MGKLRTITAVLIVGLLTACQSGDQNTGRHLGDTSGTHADSLMALANNSSIPDNVLSRLREGNRSFVSKLSSSNMAYDLPYSYFDQISQSSHEQHPIACILTCMDSRVPPEIIFDQGIGSLFVVRVAGNIEDPEILGSMEYAVAEKEISVIVVLGHKNCGAISAAFGHINPANKQLASLIAKVKMDVLANDKPPYEASAKHNVKMTIDNILKGSQTIREKSLAGGLALVGALYDVSNGTIDWNTLNW